MSAAISAIPARLEQAAAARGAPLAEMRHLHALECLLRCITDMPDSDTLILRGSLLTRQWVYPILRPVGDLDFLGAGDQNDSIMEELVRAACTGSAASADAVTFDAAAISAFPIFEYSDFPGVRVIVPASVCGVRVELNVDVGYGDPLEPPAEIFSYRAVLPENDRLIMAAPRELGFAWKLHEICISAAEWRPKDLLDSYLMALHTPMDPARLLQSIRTAFGSRNTPLFLLEPLRNGEFADDELHHFVWSTQSSDYAPLGAPPHLRAVLAPVSEILRTVLGPS